MKVLVSGNIISRKPKCWWLLRDSNQNSCRYWSKI